ncbi:HK97 family phage portal protein [Pseudaminobacter salicylatoxidans]|uniref:HK97 family phage portal protein n=1 Tax=Pseudaminobacter salicylatoxidans TaxID=93369 RepID=A0A316BPB3_PSESE|nr:phage portal protein [Pseudaminobacter salicylatoxidans]PWJ75278.1 HK97 family phage portal protein [Pseudaminobacter salicylatoxidans]
MKLFGFNVRREVRSATSPENESVPVSAENFLSFFGVQSVDLPPVTIDRALTVPAVAAAVAFLSRTLAALPLHAYQSSKDGAKRVSGKLGAVVHDNANDEMSSFLFRQYFWQQVFTGGRGLAWIERDGREIVNLWPMDPRKVTVKRVAGRRIYKFENKEYPAADVIDVPFMLKADQLSHYGPINLAAKAIQLAIAMNDYGSNFFAGGGVPPLAISGPLPQGDPALKRAAGDVDRAIKFAKENKSPILPIPAGHELKPVGFDPAKGQMVEARLFQIQEIARSWQMPPAFLQDLSKGTFANVEQQDLHLVKHLIGQWSEALEGEMNLKLFGRESGGLYVEHNLDGLMRGDFKSRVEGIARAIQTAQITPNEGRALENRPRHKNPDADELLVQGATVVLGKQPVQSALPKPADDNGEDDNAEA